MAYVVYMKYYVCVCGMGNVANSQLTHLQHGTGALWHNLRFLILMVTHRVTSGCGIGIVQCSITMLTHLALGIGLQQPFIIPCTFTQYSFIGGGKC